jgi:hypothetical protein
VVIEYVGSSCGSGSVLTNYSDAQIVSILGNPNIIPATTSTSGFFVQGLFTVGSAPFAEQTRFYAAPGSTLVAFGNGTPCNVSISGYMVTP